MVQALKYFQVYVLHSHIIVYVPDATVKEIMSQPDVDGRRGRWIEKLLEYDLEVKPTKLVRGRGMEKFMAEANYDALGMAFCEISEQGQEEEQQPAVVV